MNTDVSGWVTPELKQELHDNGAVCVRGVLDSEWVTLLGLGLERNRATPGPYAFRSYAGTEREFFNDTCNFHVIPEYRNLLYYSPIADILAELIDSRELWLFFDNFFLKEGPAAPTIWHQDVEQFICTGSQQINMWLSPDSLCAEEALAFVRGTHLGPVYDGLSPKDMADFMSARQDRIDALRAGRRGQVGPPHPDYDQPEFADRILAWDVEPGDGPGVFQHDRSWPGAHCRGQGSPQLYGPLLRRRCSLCATCRRPAAIPPRRSLCQGRGTVAAPALLSEAAAPGCRHRRVRGGQVMGSAEPSRQKKCTL